MYDLIPYVASFVIVWMVLTPSKPAPQPNCEPDVPADAMPAGAIRKMAIAGIPVVLAGQKCSKTACLNYLRGIGSNELVKAELSADGQTLLLG